MNRMSEDVAFSTDGVNTKPEDWIIVSSPISVLAIAALYVVTTMHLGPKFMKDKKPLNLKKAILIYNTAQILGCLFIIYKGWQFDKTFGFTIVCLKDQNREMIPEFFFYTFFLKMLELVETYFFVLRKKQQQVSTLHVYHHVSTMMIVYAAITHIGERSGVFYICLNCLVHIIMYAYYTAATIDNSVVINVVRKLKKYLTIIQMVQFTIVIIHMIATSLVGCQVWNNRYGPYVLLSDVIFVFFMFYNFYQESYTKKVT